MHDQPHVVLMLKPLNSYFVNTHTEGDGRHNHALAVVYPAGQCLFLLFVLVCDGKPNIQGGNRGRR